MASGFRAGLLDFSPIQLCARLWKLNGVAAKNGAAVHDEKQKKEKDRWN